MLALDALVEQRIREAQARGKFDNLPGVGTPLELEDDALVPEDRRVGQDYLEKIAGHLARAARTPPDFRAGRSGLSQADCAATGRKPCRVPIPLLRMPASPPRSQLPTRTGRPEQTSSFPAGAQTAAGTTR